MFSVYKQFFSQTKVLTKLLLISIWLWSCLETVRGQFISWIEFRASRVSNIFFKAVAKQHCLSDDVMLRQKPLLSNTAFLMTSCWRDNFQVEEFPTLFLWVKNFKVCVCFVLFCFSWHLFAFSCTVTRRDPAAATRIRRNQETNWRRCRPRNFGHQK